MCIRVVEKLWDKSQDYSKNRETHKEHKDENWDMGKYESEQSCPYTVELKRQSNKNLEFSAIYYDTRIVCRMSSSLHYKMIARIVSDRA